MYLKSLEISGFKSFAKKATLHFTSPITGIVGPNGSGKSNTAEAFRFVLGEQSIKSLRGKKGEDMIWNGGGEGSSTAGRANRASVKLVFDNSRRLFPTIDFDEVSIERVVNRDGVNEYLLNGSQVRLKDVVEMLAGAHIGATGHHIISQGEADRILGASIRERREMIEDALGLKIYQWKKIESLKKLERTEENMKQVESLRREIAPHLRFLKKQVEKVEKAEELRRELIAMYKEYFASEDHYLNTEKEKVLQELSGPKAELVELENSLVAAKKILTDSKTADQKSGEVISCEEKLKAARAEKDAAVRELGRIDGEISANRRAIEKEESRRKQEEFQTVYLKDVEEVIGRIEALQSISDAQKLFSEVIGLLKGFVTGHRTATDSAFIGEAEQEVKKLLEEKKVVEEKIKNILENETSLVAQYNALRNAIEKEKDTDREAEKSVFKIIARQNEVRNVVSNLNARLEVLNREEAAFKHELGQAGIIVGREAVDYRVIPATADNSSQSSDLSFPRKRESSVEPQTDDLGNTLDSHFRGNDTATFNDRAAQEELRRKIERNKIRLEDAGAGGGAEVIKECRETEERDAFLVGELADLEKAREELLKLVKELDVRIDLEFKSGILKINTEFQRYFNLMFGGGHAELEVVKEQRRKKSSDLEDLNGMLSGYDGSGESGASGSSENITGEAGADQNAPEGLDVNVSLPRKKVKGLMMLSGGERALTSIALLFAISQVNPPPFIILDETDAALDEANSKKYSDMIENLSKQSQLILITHNRETMSRAGVIYGVTMGADGASRLLSIAFEEAVAVAK
jgi:chromosome segregation protein